MRRAEAEAFEAMQFGDLDVLAHLPAKMLKALAVIADRAHPAYDECSRVAAGASKDKCLFMSLAVRDFLVEIGYRDATVRRCFLYIRAEDGQGREIWWVGIVGFQHQHKPLAPHGRYSW